MKVVQDGDSPAVAVMDGKRRIKVGSRHAAGKQKARQRDNT